MLKFDRLGTSLIDLLHSKHQVLLKSNGLVKKNMLRFFFHIRLLKESDLTLMCLTFKVIAQNIVPSSESVKKKKKADDFRF